MFMSYGENATGFGATGGVCMPGNRARKQVENKGYHRQ